MNHTTSNFKGLTLDQLSRRKEKCQQAIAQQESMIAELYRQMLTPVTHVKVASSYIGRRIMGGFTLFESIRWSYRIITRINRLFRRKR